jgi:hypothetical protein
MQAMEDHVKQELAAAFALAIEHGCAAVDFDINSLDWFNPGLDTGKGV